VSVVKKTWVDPVWSKVIATGILAALSYLLNLWPAIGRALLQSWAFLGRSTPVWNWVLGIGFVLVAIAILIVVASISAKKKPVSSLLSYTGDEFRGVTWQWRYGPNWAIENLHSLCPKCGLQIFTHDATGFDIAPMVMFVCEMCAYRTERMDGPASVVENLVIRLIHRNLRKRTVQDTAKNVDAAFEP
jgi:hypothetical protein